MTGRDGPRSRLRGLAPHETFRLAPGLSAPGDLALSEAADRVLDALEDACIEGHISPFTCDQYSAQITRFVRYAAAFGVTRLDAVTPLLCQDFTTAALAHGQGGTPARRGHAPSAGTQSLRRSALRAFFNTCARLGLWTEDPTRGSALGAVRRTKPLRPITPPELDLLRHFAAWRRRETLTPALLALATCGAALSETAYVLVADVDLPALAVDLPGLTRKYVPRRVYLLDWQADALAARLTALARRDRRRAPDPDLPVAFDRDLDMLPGVIAATQSQAVLRLLRRAGVGLTDRVSASALQQYTANRVYALSGIEEVRRVLGLRRLDSAEALIHSDWQGQWAEHIRLPKDGQRG